MAKRPSWCPEAKTCNPIAALLDEKGYCLGQRTDQPEGDPDDLAWCVRTPPEAAYRILVNAHDLNMMASTWDMGLHSVGQKLQLYWLALKLRKHD